jgi:hypothetical protein
MQIWSKVIGGGGTLFKEKAEGARRSDRSAKCIFIQERTPNQMISRPASRFNHRCDLHTIAKNICQEFFEANFLGTVDICFISTIIK